MRVSSDAPRVWSSPDLPAEMEAAEAGHERGGSVTSAASSAASHRRSVTEMPAWREYEMLISSRSEHVAPPTLSEGEEEGEDDEDDEENEFFEPSSPTGRDERLCGPTLDFDDDDDDGGGGQETGGTGEGAAAPADDGGEAAEGAAAAASAAAAAIAKVPETAESKRLRMRRRVLEELRSTEQSYVGSLALLEELFIFYFEGPGRAADPPYLSEAERRLLFSNARTILQLSQRLLHDLGERLDSDASGDATVGDILGEYAPFFKIYSAYVQNYSAAAAFLEERVQRNKGGRYEHARAWLERKLEDPRCRGLPLVSFLIMPVQRLPRYRLLTVSLIEYTDASHPDRAALERSLAQIEEVASHVDRSVLVAQRHAEVVAIQGRFAAGTSLVAPGRRFVRQGPLAKVGGRQSARQQRAGQDGAALVGRRRHSDRRYEFFLFNDLLVAAVPPRVVGSSKFRVHAKIPVDDGFAVFAVRPRPGEQEEGRERGARSFQVTTHGRSMTARAGTVAEREEWIRALRACVAEQRQRIRTGDAAPAAPVREKYRGAGHRCGVCNEATGRLKRRHCKACGRVVHEKCSLTRMILPGAAAVVAGRKDELSRVRVCDDCALRLREKAAASTRQHGRRGSHAGPPGEAEAAAAKHQQQQQHARTRSQSVSFASVRDQQQQQQQQPQQQHSRPPSVDVPDAAREPLELLYCRALHAYKASGSGELALVPGDMVRLLLRGGGLYWKGELRGKTGAFPSNHTQVVRVSDFEAVCEFKVPPGSGGDELGLEVGDLVRVLSVDSGSDDGWWMGRVSAGGAVREGWFPSAAVCPREPPAPPAAPGGTPARARRSMSVDGRLARANAQAAAAAAPPPPLPPRPRAATAAAPPPALPPRGAPPPSASAPPPPPPPRRHVRQPTPPAGPAVAGFRRRGHSRAASVASDTSDASSGSEWGWKEDLMVAQLERRAANLTAASAAVSPPRDALSPMRDKPSASPSRQQQQQQQHERRPSTFSERFSSTYEQHEREERRRRANLFPAAAAPPPASAYGNL